MQIGLTNHGSGGEGDSSSNGGSYYDKQGDEGAAPSDGQILRSLEQRTTEQTIGEERGKGRAFELLDTNEYVTETLPQTE